MLGQGVKDVRAKNVPTYKFAMHAPVSYTRMSLVINAGEVSGNSWVAGDIIIF